MLNSINSAQGLSTCYANNKPYPHIVIDDFLEGNFAKKITSEFPSGGEYVNFNSGYGGDKKRAFKPYEVSGEAIADFFKFSSSPVFLEYLEMLTGIKGLIPDPYYEGGGLHETLKGGRLGIHTDFRINRKLNLQRRINVIIYLNEVWDEQWEGALEIWDKSGKNCANKIIPIFNRAVIFNTNSTSFHGHPKPLNCPESVSRKSIALYYYTASELIYSVVPNNNTHYVDDGSAHLFNKLIMTLKYNLWKFVPPFITELIEKRRAHD